MECGAQGSHDLLIGWHRNGHIQGFGKEVLEAWVVRYTPGKDKALVNACTASSSVGVEASAVDGPRMMTSERAIKAFFTMLPSPS